MVEGIAFTYEQLHERTDLSLLIAASGSSPNEVTSDTAMALEGRSLRGPPWTGPALATPRTPWTDWSSTC